MEHIKRILCNTAFNMIYTCLYLVHAVQVIKAKICCANEQLSCKVSMHMQVASKETVGCIALSGGNCAVDQPGVLHHTKCLRAA